MLQFGFHVTSLDNELEKQKSQSGETRPEPLSLSRPKGTGLGREQMDLKSLLKAEPPGFAGEVTVCMCVCVRKGQLTGTEGHHVKTEGEQATCKPRPRPWKTPALLTL